MLKNAQYWIDKLALTEHPEGGYFKETYRSKDKISLNSLDSRYNSDRNVSTTIYFLLKKEVSSKFHRLKSDETWFFHTGGTIIIHILCSDGTLSSKKLGIDLENDESPQIIIPHNHWFGAEIISGDYALISCSVAPGFDFTDFELANREELTLSFKNYIDIINRLT